jgi:hypothetical protein
MRYSALGLGAEKWKARMPLDDPTPPGSADPGREQVGRTEPPRASWRKRLWRAKFLVPVVVCIGFGIGSWLIYDASSPGAMPSPSYATLVLNSASVPVDIIEYQVTQHADQANIQVWVEVSSTVPVPGATLEVIPPNTKGFYGCQGFNCGIRSASVFNVPQPLTFRRDTSNPNQETAYASFRAKNPEFGDVANGLTASAAIPLVTCTCSGSQAPVLQVQYNIAEAKSYDWSSFPEQSENSAGVIWQEPLATYGETPGRVATGVDTTTQHADGIWTFVAGAFVGIAGGALLTAVTVALDPKD